MPVPGKKRFSDTGRYWTDSGLCIRDRWLDYRCLALELSTAVVGRLAIRWLGSHIRSFLRQSRPGARKRALNPSRWRLRAMVNEPAAHIPPLPKTLAENPFHQVKNPSSVLIKSTPVQMSPPSILIRSLVAHDLVSIQAAPLASPCWVRADATASTCLFPFIHREFNPCNHPSFHWPHAPPTSKT